MNTTKIPTAEELYFKYMDHDEDGNYLRAQKAVNTAMIEFAKFHVQAALKAADENAQVCIVDKEEIKGVLHPIYGVDPDSILNAYSLENIK